ncbi:hypothetical protein EMIT0P294_50138 [Pseudomonas sp. IT-P294]
MLISWTDSWLICTMNAATRLVLTIFFFYVRPPAARRVFDLDALVLAELAQCIPDMTFVMATTTRSRLPANMQGCRTSINLRSSAALAMRR